jgi:LysM repeat protein
VTAAEIFRTVLLLLALLLPAAAAAEGITHVVQPGDSLGFIALSYDTTVEAIVQANGLPNADVIWVGQKLTIPVQASNATDTGRAGSRTIYTVKLGDTLAGIAARNGITMNALIEANGISNPDLLWVGQKLLIPGAPAGGSVPTPAVRQAKYKVKPGDTLGRIAMQYNTTAAAIARANGIISPDLIYVGMELVIPGKTTPMPLLYPGRVTSFVVSISQQRCWVYQGPAIVAVWRCSTGQRGAGTRVGSYFVQSKLPLAYGSTWDIWMPYWLGIYWAGGSENGIHGIPYNPSGWRLWEGYVGTPVTYGCILLDDENAKTLYDLAYIGMPVIVQP